MKQQLSLQLAAVKRWLKRVAPPIFALLKALNQRRERLWTSPLAYVWRNSHLGCLRSRGDWSGWLMATFALLCFG